MNSDSKLNLRNNGILDTVTDADPIGIRIPCQKASSKAPRRLVDSVKRRESTLMGRSCSGSGLGTVPTVIGDGCCILSKGVSQGTPKTFSDGSELFCEQSWTKGLLRGLSVVVELAGGDSRLVGQLRRQIGKHLSAFRSPKLVSHSDQCLWYSEEFESDGRLERLWLAQVKWILSYPLAIYLRNSPPKAPEGFWNPSGSLDRWMKARFRRFCPENTRLWYSWFQAKRACVPLSASYVEKAYLDHYAVLGSQDPGCDLTISKIMENTDFRRILKQVSKSVVVKLASLQPYYSRTPSLGACFEETRSRYGQLGYLVKTSQPSFCLNCKKSFEFILASCPDCKRKSQICSWSPSVDFFGFSLNRVWNGVGFRSTPEPAYLPSGSDDWCLHDHRLRKKLGGDKKGDLLAFLVDKKFTSLDDLIHVIEAYDPLNVFEDDSEIGDPMDDNAHAMIQAILEPLKCRIISKGPGLEYYSMKSLQLALHASLREIPCFRLIGRPLEVTDLAQCFHTESFGCDEWVSVDYSAATDNLSWKLSKLLLQETLSELPDSIRRTADFVLGPHHLHYPPNPLRSFGERPSSRYMGLQNRGQLMGSILSFIYLCLANLGLYLHVTADYTLARRKLDPGYKPEEYTLINGDDQLYRGNKYIFRDHVIMGKRIGLEMSHGKAYIHPEYCNVNSVSLHCKTKGDAKVIPYFNTGLYYGQSKVLGGSEKRDESERPVSFRDRIVDSLPSDELATSKVSTLNWLLYGTPRNYRCTILRRWIRRFKRDIQRESACVLIGSFSGYSKAGRVLASRNLFLPISVGGLGVDPPEGWRFKISKIDKLIARSILDTTNLPVATELPSAGLLTERKVSVPFYRLPKTNDRIPEYRVRREMPVLPSNWLRGFFFMDKIFVPRRTEIYKTQQLRYNLFNFVGPSFAPINRIHHYFSIDEGYVEHTFEISISSPPLSLGSADLKIIESSSSRAEISY